MKAKTHYYYSTESPRFGEDLTAVCGQVVPKAQPAPAMWEPGQGSLCKCDKCKDSRIELGTWKELKNYEAIILSGQESVVAAD